MAYETNADLPDAVKDALPANAQTIYRDAFNAAYGDAEDEERATKAAWAAVKDAGYVKDDDGKWAKPDAAGDDLEDELDEADLGMSDTDKRSALCAAIDDALGIADDAQYDARPWVRDIFPGHVVYEYDGSSWMCEYSIEGGNVKLGSPAEVRVSYEPVGGSTEPPEPGVKTPPDEPTTEPPVPSGAPESGSEAGARGRDRRGRRRDGAATEGARFDPTSKDSLTGLASAMLADGHFAAEVCRVAEQLRGRDMTGDFVRIEEKAVRDDGSAFIKLIQPGWGSSGYYGSEMLESDGPVAFPKGTKMYWNHQTEQEESERPEGDLRNLAGELLEDAKWMTEGPDGPGLYAQTKVFSEFADQVEELAPHIGVSIRAYGKASEGSAEGREGTIIDTLTWGQSVDYVTEPGAGGKVLELFEAAGRTSKEGQMSDQEKQQVREAKESERRALEALAVRDAKDIVAKALDESTLPEPTQKRLVESLTGKVELTDDGKLDEAKLSERAAEAIKAEAEYLESLGAGRVQGMGPSGEGNTSEDQAREKLAKSLQRTGMSESAAKAAAAAR